MRELPTFVENDPVPCDFMDWTLFSRKVSRKRVVSSQDNIRVFNLSDFCLALLTVIFSAFERAV